MQYTKKEITIGGTVYELNIRPISRKDMRELSKKGINLRSLKEEQVEEVMEWVTGYVEGGQDVLDELPAGIDTAVFAAVLDLSFNIEREAKN